MKTKASDMRIKVENASQMRIAMLLLKEITGLDNPESVERYVEEYSEMGFPKDIGACGGEICSWSPAFWNDSISFEDFLREVPRLLKEEKQITVGDYIVKFVEGGIKVGCTFVPSKTVEAIYKKLFDKSNI